MRVVVIVLAVILLFTASGGAEPETGTICVAARADDRFRGQVIPPEHAFLATCERGESYSTMSSLCMPLWPKPQTWQQWSSYVPGVCATNSIVVVSFFLSWKQSCGEVKTSPGLLSFAPSGTVAILKP